MGFGRIKGTRFYELPLSQKMPTLADLLKPGKKTPADCSSAIAQQSRNRERVMRSPWAGDLRWWQRLLRLPTPHNFFPVSQPLGHRRCAIGADYR